MKIELEGFDEIPPAEIICENCGHQMTVPFNQIRPGGRFTCQACGAVYEGKEPSDDLS
ncbi:hypothetical protein [Sorangium sp. So ce385]|uniref:hypothetical protein n=1 Tax=Sorangium sp. So ce385 TaxID=3133308 RepID=UPI003F5B125E